MSTDLILLLFIPLFGFALTSWLQKKMEKNGLNRRSQFFGLCKQAAPIMAVVFSVVFLILGLVTPSNITFVNSLLLGLLSSVSILSTWAVLYLWTWLLDSGFEWIASKRK